MGQTWCLSVLVIFVIPFVLHDPVWFTFIWSSHTHNTYKLKLNFTRYCMCARHTCSACLWIPYAIHKICAILFRFTYIVYPINYFYMLGTESISFLLVWTHWEESGSHTNTVHFFHHCCSCSLSIFYASKREVLSVCLAYCSTAKCGIKPFC